MCESKYRLLFVIIMLIKLIFFTGFYSNQSSEISRQISKMKRAYVVLELLQKIQIELYSNLSKMEGTIVKSK